MTLWAFLKDEVKIMVRGHESGTGRWKDYRCLVLVLIFMPKESWPSFVKYLGRQFGRLFDSIVNRRYFS